MLPTFSLRAATDADARWIAELRADVLRDDLVRLGRYDPVRVRQRFLDGFEAGQTQVILVDGVEAGSLALRPTSDCQWIEHFYIDRCFQGRGLGGSVLAHVMTRHSDARAFRLNVLAGSPAQRLYLRHGFTIESEDPIDVYMVAPGRPA
ncbi:GNAT family N-acetyltransferase [Paeniglutamicibacter sp. MACA_103]|uniref:GNAT family N-acetyltransferase n=1 Tax=Paeniglutamicibacter sp. MACA_103 TaxID=3377337 RepID=UPI003894C9D7